MEYELITKTESGALSLSPQVESLVDEAVDLLNDAQHVNDELKENILNAMK